MKSVENRLYIFILLLLFSCQNSNTEISKSNEEKLNGSPHNDSSNVYDVVSNLYYIDIFGKNQKFITEDKEVFIIEKSLFVLDSCFGSYNEKNTQKAYQYANQGIDIPVYLSNDIKIKRKDNTFRTLFKADISESLLANIELRQGYSFKNNEKYKKFLRVILQFQNGTLDLLCLNFGIDEQLNWYLISKELINTSDSNFFANKGYCIDTTSKHINTKEIHIPANSIDFFAAFDNLVTECY